MTDFKKKRPVNRLMYTFVPLMMYRTAVMLVTNWELGIPPASDWEALEGSQDHLV